MMPLIDASIYLGIAVILYLSTTELATLLVYLLLIFLARTATSLVQGVTFILSIVNVAFSYTLIISALFLLWSFGLCVRVVNWARHLYWQDIRTKILSWFIFYPDFDHNLYRSSFRNTPMVYRGVENTNLHGESASIRSAGSASADFYIKSMGLKPYYIQQGKTDQRRGHLGSRSYHWMRDIDTKISKLEDVSEYGLVMVDTAFYLDMHWWLAGRENVTLLVTVNPKSVSKIGKEVSYKFDHRNDGDWLDFRVKGNSRYYSQVWDWNSDTIVVRHIGWFTTTFTSYNVERRAISENLPNDNMDHDLVLLTPVASLVLPLWWSTSPLKGKLLERFKVSEGDWNSLIVFEDEGPSVSIGKAGSYNSFRVPLEVHEGLRSNAISFKSAITSYQIKKSSSEAKIVMPHHELQLAVEYYKAKTPKSDNWTYQSSVAITGDVIRFGFHPTLEEMAKLKPAIRSFMGPLYKGAHSPAVSFGNRVRSVESRVIALQQGSVNPSNFVLKTMNEFVEFVKEDLLQGDESLEPYDEEKCLSRQVSKTQQEIYTSGLDARYASNHVGSFGKREASTKINDLRNITNFSGADKVAIAPFAYAAMDRAKYLPWYGGSKPPADLSRRVAELASKAAKMLMSDFVRQDGTTKIPIRIMERKLFIALFDRIHHELVLKGISLTYNRLVRMEPPDESEDSWSYQQGTGVGSGSLLTTFTNTAGNAFCMYLSFRMYGLEPRHSYDSLGVYMGDDGLTPNPSPYVERAAEALGYRVTIDMAKRGERITLCSRQFGPAVWNGDPDNCCSFYRTITKLHLTTSICDPITKVYQKAMALRCTDPNTPIFGDWSLAVLKHISKFTGKSIGQLERDNPLPKSSSWFARKIMDGEPAFVNQNNNGWMWDYASEELETFDYAKLQRWIVWLEDAGDINAVLKTPMCGGLDEIVAKKAVTDSKDDVAVEFNGDTVKVQVDTPVVKKSPELSYWDYCDQFQVDKCKVSLCGREHAKRPKYCRAYSRDLCKRKKCKHKHEIVYCKKFIRGECANDKCWKCHDLDPKDTSEGE